MYKSLAFEIYFEFENERNQFDTWFENNLDSNLKLGSKNFYELIDSIDEYLDDKDWDYTFGKDGNEESYRESVEEFYLG